MKRRSLRWQLVALFSGVAAILIGVTQVISYVRIREAVNDVSVSTMRNYLNQTINSLDFYLSDVENTAKNITALDEVQQALRDADRVSGLDALLTYRKLQNTYRHYTNTRTHIQRVYLLSRSGKFLDIDYYKDEMLLQSDWLTELRHAEPERRFSKLHVITAPLKTTVFTLQHPVYSIRHPREVIGWVLIDIDAVLLERAISLEAPYEGSSILLRNEDGETLVARGDLSAIPRRELDALAKLGDGAQLELEGQMVFSAVSPVSQWHLAVAVPKDALTRDAGSHAMQMIVTALCAVAVFVIMASLCIHQAFKPLMSISEAMDTVSSGDFSVRLPVCVQSETRRLIVGFNSMVEHICELVERVSKEERCKKDIELQALRAQVSPHFLYNSLNSVRYLARMGRNDDVQTATSSLIHLLQASFERTRYITIEREMQLVRDYMSIQKLRYDLPLELLEEMDAQAMCCLIPGFTIQPIVENALFHGIVPNQGGHIRISIRAEGEFVRIAIADDGVGMPQSKREELLHVDGKDPKSFTSIGVFNVSSRLRFFHIDVRKDGEATGRQCLTIESEIDKGSCVRMCIPRLEAKADAEGADRR